MIPLSSDLQLLVSSVFFFLSLDCYSKQVAKPAGGGNEDSALTVSCVRQVRTSNNRIQQNGRALLVRATKTVAIVSHANKS